MNLSSRTEVKIELELSPDISWLKSVPLPDENMVDEFIDWLIGIGAMVASYAELTNTLYSFNRSGIRPYHGGQRLRRRGPHGGRLPKLDRRTKVRPAWRVKWQLVEPARADVGGLSVSDSGAVLWTGGDKPVRLGRVEMWLADH